MRVLLLGATGRTGRIVLSALLERGDEVTTLGRRPPPTNRATNIVGDLSNPQVLAEAASGVDVVINCLQSPGNPPLCSTIAETLAAHEATLKYVTVGGAGVDRPLDRKGAMDKLVGRALKLLQPALLADRQREVDILAGSGLRWTMLRPPRLTDAQASGRWTFTFDRPAKLQIGRADLAAAVIESIGRSDLEGKAPFVSAC